MRISNTNNIDYNNNMEMDVQDIDISNFNVNEELYSIVSKNKLIRLKGKINGIDALILIDSGSSADFINEMFVQKHAIPTSSNNNNNNNSISNDNSKDNCRKIVLANGSSYMSDKIVESAEVKIGSSYNDNIQFTVFPLSKYDAILGMPWLEKHNPQINFKNKTVQFQSNNNNHNNNDKHDCHDSTYNNPSHRSIKLVTSKQIKRQAAKNNNLFLVYLYCLDDGSIDRIEQRECNNISMNNNKNETVNSDVESLLSKYKDVFPDDLPTGLPPSRIIDHKIDIIPGSSAPSLATYRMSPTELDAPQKLRPD